MTKNLLSYRFSVNGVSNVARATQDVNLLLKQGFALHQQGKLSQAEFTYSQALKLQPNNFDALQLSGVIAGQNNNHILAIELLRRAVEINPQSFAAHLNIGLSLMALNRVEEAIACYDHAIKLMPESAEAYINKGVSLECLDRSKEAIECFDRTISIKPDYSRAYYNRGISLTSLGRLDDAIKSYDLAIKLNPKDSDSYFNKSLILLTLGDFDMGWSLYEWRWKKEGFTEKKRDFTEPLWLGASNIYNKTILIYAEQGLGDTIQFCRYVSLVSQLGGEVILEAQSPLVNLLSGLEGVGKIFSRGETLPSFDYQCPLMSLPLAFGTRINSIPNQNPYLFSSQDKREAWSLKLGEKNLPRIGLVWSGNAKYENDKIRSILLSDLIGYLPRDFEYVSLQKELRDGDLELLSNNSIRHFGDDLYDFSDTAALCDLMNLVLSVDTGVAHLAGALGKPTWVLLPHKSEFRWLLDKHDSPWYPSVKLYRQDESKRWDRVIDTIAKDLLEIFH